MTAFERALKWHAQGQALLAESEYRNVLEAQPRHVASLSNLGVLLMERGLLQEAEAQYKAAIEVRPDFSAAHNNLGNVLRDQNRVAESMIAYQRAAQLKPDYVDAEYGEALAALKLGLMPECWRMWERRWQTKYLRGMQTFAYPRYDGSQSLQGKKILVYSEQGMGDVLQMIRYIPLLKARDASEIHLKVHSGLMSLVSRVPGVSKTYDTVDAIGVVDYCCPVMSLPLAFSTRADNIPNVVPYLCADSQRSEEIGKIVQRVKGLKIGVCWKGNPKFSRDHERSPGIEVLRPLFHSGLGSFFSLVPDSRVEFLNVAGPNAIDLGHDLVASADGYDDTAALISNLDLIITSDTSVCHLAGAMGKPVWLMLAFVADWRWLLDREDSPWYPTMHLFRQPAAGDWGSVIVRVLQRLQKVTSGQAAV